VGTLLGARNSPTTRKGSETDNVFVARAMAMAELARTEQSSYVEPIKCRQSIKADIASSVRAQGVPERILSTFISDTEPRYTTAMKAVSRFMKASRDGWCLILAGPKGTGKSTAAAHYLWATAPKGYSGLPTTQRWWTAAKVSRVSSYDDQLESLMKVPVLVIDDLGVEYIDKNGHFLSRLDELIDARWSNFRRTIITTNLNPPDFQKRYNSRVTDRIRHGFKHGGEYVQINEKSLRA